MEALLHYVWRHQLCPAGQLTTTKGDLVEVLAPGIANHDAGPDFFNSQLRIAGTLWAGNVELHVCASQWFEHHHHTDAAYNNTILHVVCQADAEAVTADGKHIATLVMPIPDHLKEGYAELLRTADYPRCHTIVPDIKPIMAHSWMNTLLVERMEQRAALVQQRADQCGGDWERAFFITLARNFGFGKNGDTFEQWARLMPLAAAAHHRDDIMQVEALFLGSAGLLSTDALPRAHREAGAADAHFVSLQREYAYLSAKFSLTDVVDGARWKFLRLRPQMFPHIKLVQLATLFYHRHATLSRIVDMACRAADATALLRALDAEMRLPVPDYWQHHYIFGMDCAAAQKRLSESSLRLIVINTIVPVLWAYAAHRHDPALSDRAMALLEQLPAEHNYITRQWQACGLPATTAADSQALIHLKTTRCDTGDCLHCRFGYEYLKRTSTSRQCLNTSSQ